MNKRQAKKMKARAEPVNKQTVSWLCSQEAFDTLTCQGYTSLDHNPEIITAVNKIAKLIGSMTIHLMQNTDDGDVRVKNELSRKIDINPNANMTRSAFIQWIVNTLFLYGDGNAVVYPKFSRGYLRDLKPMPAAMVAFIPEGIWDYKVLLNGQEYDPDRVLHFVLNPGNYYPWRGTGLQVALKDVANNLKQAAATEKGFMSSKWKPSIIVKVDALTEEFSSPAGRRQLLSDYIDTTQAGEPWMIPAEQFEIEQIKPLSLSDLALADMVQLDKKTVASILGVPPFVLGVGEFNREEWNNFINSTVMPLAQMIEQELTKKLLYSPEFYFRFNPRSLYNYELRDLAAIADDQYIRGIMTRDEVRDWIGLPPASDSDELIILENFIPVGMIGDQKKLNGN
jgi:HK97 family phage portal protein